MKKMLLAIAAIMMSASVMAQQETTQREVRKPMDKMEMVKQRTEQMVKKYELNETQAGQLLEVNKEFADEMGHRMHGQRPDGPRKKMMPSPKKMEKDSLKMKPMDGRKVQLKMRETREAYDAKLKEIMTEEQFKAYKTDEQNRPHKNMGPRGHKERNN